MVGAEMQEDVEMNDSYFMEHALAEARTSLEKDFLPVGAVAVQNGVILGRAHKEGKTHPHLDHAERNLIDKLATDSANRKDLRGVTVYVTLEPCLQCLGTMLNMRVSRVVYAINDPHGGGLCMLKSDLPPRHAEDFPGITGGVGTKEAKELFSTYFTTTKSRFWKNPENPLVKLCCAEK